MKTKMKIAKAVAKLSYKMAEKSANSACVFLHGQEELPESVINLKRKNTKKWVKNL